MDEICDQNKDTLDELNKGCTMGMDAIKCVLEKVDERNFKSVLENQYNVYQKFHKKIERIYSKYSSEFKNPMKTNILDKAMIWSGVEMKTINDVSISKLSQILIEGTNMGIIEGRKLLNHKTRLEKDVKKILEEYINIQEQELNTLKNYL